MAKNIEKLQNLKSGIILSNFELVSIHGVSWLESSINSVKIKFSIFKIVIFQENAKKGQRKQK